MYVFIGGKSTHIEVCFESKEIILSSHDGVVISKGIDLDVVTADYMRKVAEGYKNAIENKCHA